MGISKEEGVKNDLMQLSGTEELPFSVHDVNKDE